MNEQEMREATVPWLKTPEELTAYIEGLVKQEHDYGTCVYAMSMAATAAFYYVSGQLDVTGFQASCADMDILTRTRGMKGPWRIVDYDKALFPQYAQEFQGQSISKETADWLKEEGQKKLEELGDGMAHHNVMEHWKYLADGNVPFGMSVKS